jgi:hypothetical protein
MNKYYNTFVYLDRNKINLRTVFNLEYDVKVGFENEFTHLDKKYNNF